MSEESGDYTYWIVAAGDEVEVAVDEEHGHRKGDGSLTHPNESSGAGPTRADRVCWPGITGFYINMSRQFGGAEGSVSLLFHAFYVSALVGLIFPLTALDIRLRASYCQKHPTYNPTILKQPGGGPFSPRTLLWVL